MRVFPLEGWILKVKELEFGGEMLASSVGEGKILGKVLEVGF